MCLEQRLTSRRNNFIVSRRGNAYPPWEKCPHYVHSFEVLLTVSLHFTYSYSPPVMELFRIRIITVLVNVMQL